MANQSKYSFSEVEKKLDIIKDNQGSNKVLLGDGTYGEKPKDGIDGDDGVGIGNIQKTNTVGLVDTYTITFTDGNTTTFTITNGENGTDGVGIVSVQKTATNGLVDTYTITFTNKSTSTFEVTNGADGSGNSVTEEQIANAVEAYLTENPVDGSVSTEEIEKAVVTYMEANAENFKGEPGEAGKDGVSPAVEVEEVAGGYKVTITDVNEEKSIVILDGEDGVTPTFTIGTVETLEAGSNATASITGTTENPVLNLGIPKGEKGAAGSSTGTGGEIVYYKPVAVETTAGIYWKADGTLGDSTAETDEYIKKVSATGLEQYIPVEEGEVYRISMGSILATDTSCNASLGVFLDDNDTFIANLFDTKTYKDNELVTVPAGATKMHFTVWTHVTFKVEKQTTEPYGVVNQFELLNRMEKIQEEGQTFKRKTFAPFDKAYITFVTDDCRGDLSEIVDVFANKAVPLCSATIYGTMTNLCNTGTVLDALKKMVENGGEVLSHGATQITEETIEDFDTLYDQFAKSKEILELYGFDVNGVILAGGTGYVAGDQRTDKWARAYYQYSDLYGNSEYGYPYYHYRTALSNYTLDTAKAKVDEVIEKKEWIIFYLHEWTEFSKSDMEELLDYINQTEPRVLGFATYKQMYDKFCISYPKTLKAITADKLTTVYPTGGTIGTSDITVTAYYSDGTTEKITSGITVDLSDVNTSEVGNYYIGVTWQGLTVYLPISIYASEDRVVLYSGTEGSYITWELYNDGTLELTNTAGWKQSVQNYTDGQQPWYDYMSLIKKVKVNAGSYMISTIGEYAFYGAKNLTEIDFAENTDLLTLSAYSFGNCGLTTPTIENLYTVQTGAFSGCPMTEITLGSSMLSYNAFEGCSQLAIVKLTSSTMTIDNGAFNYNKETITDVYVAWSEGAVDGAPWRATNATIHYNTTT